MMCEPMPITIGTRFDKSTPGFKLFFGWVNVEGRLRDRPYGRMRFRIPDASNSESSLDKTDSWV